MVLSELNRRGINAVFHYLPLHTSPAGIKYGRIGGDLSKTESISDRLVRLPLWMGISEEEILRSVDALEDIFR